jgi:hypothetical protein
VSNYYRVFDTLTETYWSSNSRDVWGSIGSAKAAYINEHNRGKWDKVSRRYIEPITWNEQTRFVIHEYCLTYSGEVK